MQRENIITEGVEAQTAMKAADIKRESPRYRRGSKGGESAMSKAQVGNNYPWEKTRKFPALAYQTGGGRAEVRGKDGPTVEEDRPWVWRRENRQLLGGGVEKIPGRNPYTVVFIGGYGVTQ